MATAGSAHFELQKSSSETGWWRHGHCIHFSYSLCSYIRPALSELSSVVSPPEQMYTRITSKWLRCFVVGCNNEYSSSHLLPSSEPLKWITFGFEGSAPSIYLNVCANHSWFSFTYRRTVYTFFFFYVSLQTAFPNNGQGSRGLMDRALDLKPEVTQGCGFESRLRQEVSTTEVRPLSKAPIPQTAPRVLHSRLPTAPIWMG